MNASNDLYAELIGVLQERFGEKFKDYLFPPPVFGLMQGELVGMDLPNGALTVRFPVLESYRNPYGLMQGGMLAAAVDNTLGPLSVLVAPPNVTRTLEMKYSRPANLEMGFILVQARLVERQGLKLYFEARVSSPDGQKLATCKAMHWIIEDL